MLFVAATAAIAVSFVRSAHHGRCSPKSARLIAQRLEPVLARPLAYRPYHCMSWTEDESLRAGCTEHANVIFVHFARPVLLKIYDPYAAHVRIYVPVRVLGFAYKLHRTVILIPNREIKESEHNMLPEGWPRNAPETYGPFDVYAPELRLADGECP